MGTCVSQFNMLTSFATILILVASKSSSAGLPPPAGREANVPEMREGQCVGTGFICYRGYDQMHVGSGFCCDPESVCNVINPEESAFCKKATETNVEEQCVGTDFICYRGYDLTYVGSGSCCDPDSVCNVEKPWESAFCKKANTTETTTETTVEEQCVGTDFICYRGYDQEYVGSCCDPDSVCKVENPEESAFCKKATTTVEEQCVGTEFICYRGYDQEYVGSGSCCDPDSVCKVENPEESAFCKKTVEEQCVGTDFICYRGYDQ